MLWTSTDLSAEEVAQAYKRLWRVERTFRGQKSTLQIRPIYHQRDSQCVGHIVASFLALRLEVDLQKALDEGSVDVSWPELRLIERKSEEGSKRNPFHYLREGWRFQNRGPLLKEFLW